MFSRTASVAIAATAIFATTSQTVAGGYAAASCYEQIRQPAVYRTIHEQVMVSPGGRQVQIIPAIYGTVEREIVIPFSEMLPSSTSAPRAVPLNSIVTMQFVVDSVHTPLGQSGRFWIGDIRYQR